MCGSSYRRRLRGKQVFAKNSSKWGDPQARLLAGEAWQQARPTVPASVNLTRPTVPASGNLTGKGGEASGGVGRAAGRHLSGGRGPGPGQRADRLRRRRQVALRRPGAGARTGLSAGSAGGRQRDAVRGEPAREAAGGVQLDRRRPGVHLGPRRRCLPDGPARHDRRAAARPRLQRRLHPGDGRCGCAEVRAAVPRRPTSLRLATYRAADAALIGHQAPIGLAQCWGGAWSPRWTGCGWSCLRRRCTHGRTRGTSGTGAARRG